MTTIWSHFFSWLIFGSLLSFVSQHVKASHVNAEEQPTASSLVLASPKEKSIWGIGEEQLDELFSSTSTLVCSVDDQSFYRINATYLKTFGWDEQHLRSRPHTDYIHPDDQPSSRTMTDRITKNGSSVCEKFIPALFPRRSFYEAPVWGSRTRFIYHQRTV